MLQEILNNKSIKCKCGKTHTLNIENIFIEKDAERHLTKLVKPYKSILLLSNQITFDLCKDSVLKYLKDFDVKQLIFSENYIIANEETVNTIYNNLDGIDLIIGIGSGVIQDLAKYTSFKKGIDYFILATAPSMDGYASIVSVMFFNGHKTSIPTHLPKVILGNVDILKNAPLPAIQAGFGDIIGKYSSLNDWKLASLLYNEYFCDYIYELVQSSLNKVVENAEKIYQKQDEGITILMQALILVGIAMSFAGNSRPASGSEHHISHFFEVTGILHNKKYLPHGKNVAYASMLTAKIRQKLLKVDFSTITPIVLEHNEYLEKMQLLYKQSSEEYTALQENAGRFKEDRISLYRKNQKEIKEILTKMPTYEEIRTILSKCGLDFKEFTSTYSKELILYSLKYSKYLKDRFSVLWLYNDLLNTPTISNNLI